MDNEEDALAQKLFTADTGRASLIEWANFGNRDKYERMARVAINFLRHHEGTVARTDGLIGMRRS